MTLSASMRTDIIRKVFILILSFAALSCAPAQKNAPPQELTPRIIERCKPGKLAVDSTSNKYVRIAWDPGCPPIRILQGFNIYAYPHPLGLTDPNLALPESIKPLNPEVYPGDTEGNLNRETYELKNLDIGVKYYVHVRAVYDDGTLSTPTNEIEIICYPQGIIELNRAHSGEKDGFSFEKFDYYGTDALINDIYYYNKDGKDYLCSAARISAVNKKTRLFSVQGGESLRNMIDMEPSGVSSERLEIREGDNCLIKTEAGYSIAARIMRFEGESEIRRVIIEYLCRPPDVGNSSRR
jgi:Fibronectin type III domain